MRDKLNKLSLLLPEGCVASVPWLRTQGYSTQLVQRYHKSGRLVQLGRSAYHRLGRLPQWQDVVISLNKCWNMVIHVGAVAALELHGLGHYVRLGDNPRVYVFIHGPKAMPQWVRILSTGAVLVHAKATLFSPPDDMKGLADVEWPRSPWPLRVATPERAILEMLDLVPGQESFEHALLVAGGLMTLRPDVLMSLLHSCSSVKVKRLFLYLADRLALPCFQHLDASQIDLGKGTRQIVKNGKYDSKYRITVPGKLP